jgi:hypothetical protein
LVGRETMKIGVRVSADGNEQVEFGHDPRERKRFIHKNRIEKWQVGQLPCGR